MEKWNKRSPKVRVHLNLRMETRLDLWDDVDRILGYMSTSSFYKISFENTYKIIYDASTLTPLNNFIEFLINHVRQYFETNIQQHLASNVDDLSKLNSIFHDYQFYSKVFTQSFTTTERMHGNYSFGKEIRSIFIDEFKRFFQFHFVVHTYIDELQVMRESRSYKSFERFSYLENVSLLIRLVYSNKESEYSEEVCKSTHEFTQSFVINTEPCNFVEDSLQLLDNEKSVSMVLYNQKMANDVVLTTYTSLMNRNTKAFQYCLQQITQDCKSRETSFISLFYSLVCYFNPSQETLDELSKSIRNQLDNESVEIPQLGDVVDWYDKLVSNVFKNKAEIKAAYDTNVVSFVNRSSNQLLKDLVRFIAQSIKDDKDIKQIQPVLSRLIRKSELEILHIRNVTRRLIPLKKDKIEKEREIMQQIKASSAFYDMKSLSTMLHEADQSMENHIGPVLIVQSGIWPFRQPYPQPINLFPTCTKIENDYSRLFPNRILKFPIDSWQLNIKDNVRNLAFVCNGLQAEVFLFLNSHRSIKTDMLEPQISQRHLRCVLASLSNLKLPILKCTDEEYFVNPGFKNKKQIIRIPRPIYNEQASVEVQNQKVRDDALDAFIVRTMKGKRFLSMIDLDEQIRVFMANRFQIDNKIIHDRIQSLIANGFIEMNNDYVKYVP